MRLHSDNAYWFLKNGLIQSYPTLREDLTADVVVVGGGITGALIAHELIDHDISVVVLESRDIGCGSTCASTALLQYEIDTHLTDLKDWYGDVADDLYRSGVAACDRLKSLADGFSVDVGFRQCPSCYFASDSSEQESLRTEFELRRRIGLPVEFWDQSRLRDRFDFEAPAAIWSRDAAQIDPYRLTHALLSRIQQRHGRVFDRSPVQDVQPRTHGTTFKTREGSVTARYGVVAAGYEGQAFLPRPVATLKSTFAFVSEPLAEFPGWYERCLIWEMSRPYLYLRTTDDDRLLAGGEDLPFKNETIRDSMLASRTAQIEQRVRQMFPRIPFAIDYAWAGTFGETPDGLPFIGAHNERPGLLFALCYGGNGITFSVLASEIIRDHVLGRTHPLAYAVSFDRRLPK